MECDAEKTNFVSGMNIRLKAKMYPNQSWDSTGFLQLLTKRINVLGLNCFQLRFFFSNDILLWSHDSNY